MHIEIRLCSGTHYSENSSCLHTTYRSLLFHDHRLAKTDFHSRCKHVSEPENNSSLSHARAFRSPLVSKRTSISKFNEDQKNLFFGFKLTCIFRKHGVPPAEVLHTTHICSIFGYEKLKALLYIRLLFLQCTACKTKLVHPKELRKMG